MGVRTQWMVVGGMPSKGVVVGPRGFGASTRAPAATAGHWAGVVRRGGAASPGLVVPCARREARRLALCAVSPPALAGSEEVFGCSLVWGCLALSQGGSCCWVAWWCVVGSPCRSHRVASLSGRHGAWGRGYPPSLTPLRGAVVLSGHRAGRIAPYVGCCSPWARGSQVVLGRTVSVGVVAWLVASRSLARGPGSWPPRSVLPLPSCGSFARGSNWGLLGFPRVAGCRGAPVPTACSLLVASSTS